MTGNDELKNAKHAERLIVNFVLTRSRNSRKTR